MSSISKHTTYETWTVEELIDATSTNPRGNKTVSIPQFQRRLVWPKRKQDLLIDSIKRSFPFGSLLLYKDQNNTDALERYKLIDGLQRTQTLRNYSRHPNSSFKSTEFPDNFIDLVARSIDAWSELDCLASRNVNRLRRLILEWVWESRGFTEADGWGATALTEKLLRDMAELEEDTYEFYMARRSLLENDSVYRHHVQTFLDSIQKTSDIGKVEVPVIIYAGPSSELPTLFVLLNTQGIKLSRYDIYAAQWLDYRYRVENPDIIDAIWRMYGTLEDEGLNLDVAADGQDAISRIERPYTLFEYLFGLGQCLTRDFPQFFKPVKVDVPSPVGFNLVSACVGSGVADNDVRNLPNEIRGLDISKLEACLLESVDFVNRVMQPVLGVQRSGQVKIPYYHADLQLVSIIATAFRVRYNCNDLSELESWAEKRSRLLQQIPMYYLFDILSESWRGAGDNRLVEVLTSERYLQLPPTDRTWDQALSIWYRNHVNTRHHAQSYIKDDFPEYLLLRYVLKQRLQRAQTFHVQHIVPVSRLVSPPSHYHEFYGPINSISNLALVAEEEYTDFNDTTFIEYLNRQRNIGAIRGPGRFNDELQNWQRRLICEAEMLPSDLTERAFLSFLRKRFELLKREFIRVWRDHIPAEPQI